MAVDARAVANELLQIASKDDRTIDPLKLQKLLYFAHGWHLAIKKEPLIDEYVEAWQYGPVIPSVYHALKKYGNNAIDEPARDYKFVGGKLESVPFDLAEEYKENPDHKQFTCQLLKKIWDVYKTYSGVQLSNITHTPGSPWEITWTKAGGRKNAPINDELISDYFTDLARSHD